MASSTHEHHHPTPYAATTAPPPTPSAQPNSLFSSSDAADSLSRLLHRLPPTLSLSFPNRRQSPPPTTTTTSLPLISLSDPKPTLHSNLLSAARQRGFFQLTHHPISHDLATSAESDSLSIFNQKQLMSFPKNNNWPLGFDEDEDDDEENINGRTLCLDSSCTVESTELTFLREFSCQMEKLGLEVIQELACAVGFENPVGKDPTRVCSLMWISESGGSSSGDNKLVSSGRLYPFVVGLHYQIRCRKYAMLADSGWVCVSPQVDSVLVTLGDIAQVWSNGKVKKVQGRPVSSNSNGDGLSMTLLVTLALDSTVAPLLPKSLPLTCCNYEEDDGLGDNNSKPRAAQDSPTFNPFSFEDYAWRMYHERLRLHFKDPLVRYRV